MLHKSMTCYLNWTFMQVFDLLKFTNLLLDDTIIIFV